MPLKLSFAQREYLLVFVFSLAVVFGNAYLVLVNHDANFSADEASYLALAKGDWNVNITHRYRVIVPALARGLAEFLQLVRMLAGKENAGLPLGFAFFLVNSTIMALVGLLIYRIVKVLKVNFASRFMAVLGVLTSGYCSYLSGIALVDSLYMLMLVMLFYALLVKSEMLLFCCLVIGPLAKESFWLFIPVVLLFSRFTPFTRLSLYILLSIFIFIANNTLVDSVSGIEVSTRTGNALGHVNNAFLSARRLFSWSGFWSWFSAFGVFNFLVMAGLFTRGIRVDVRNRFVQMQILFLLIVAVHILLSGDIGRMWYLAAPVYAVALAFSTERLLVPLFSGRVSDSQE